MMYKLSETPAYVSFFMSASLTEGFFGVRVKRVLKRDLQTVVDPQLVPVLCEFFFDSDFFFFFPLAFTLLNVKFKSNQSQVYCFAASLLFNESTLMQWCSYRSPSLDPPGSSLGQNVLSSLGPDHRLFRRSLVVPAQSKKKKSLCSRFFSSPFLFFFFFDGSGAEVLKFYFAPLEVIWLLT